MAAILKSKMAALYPKKLARRHTWRNSGKSIHLYGRGFLLVTKMFNVVLFLGFGPLTIVGQPADFVLGSFSEG